MATQQVESQLVPLAGTIDVDGDQRVIGRIRSISIAPMKRERFPIEHPTEPGFPSYAVAQRLNMLRFAAWVVRTYRPHARRRCEVWALVTGFAAIETGRILNRAPTRAERRLCADVTWHLWAARVSVDRWNPDDQSEPLENLSPALAASLAIRRIASGSGEVLTESAIEEMRRLLHTHDQVPLSPQWVRCIVLALIASHESLRKAIVDAALTGGSDV